MDFPGKPQQFFDSDTKPLMDQENLDALISRKKPEKRARIRKPFRGSQQLGAQNSTGRFLVEPFKSFCRAGPLGCPSAIQPRPVSTIRLERFDEESAAPPKNNSIGAATVDVTSDTQQDENQSRGPPEPCRRSSISSVQESHRGSQTPKSGLLQQPICHSKENRVTQTNLRNGNIDVDMPDDSTQGLHQISGSGGCIYAHIDTKDMKEVSPVLLEQQSIPVPRTSIWSITNPAYIYLGTETSDDMGTITGNAGISVFRRPSDSGRIQGGMQFEHQPNLLQAYRTGVQNKGGEIIHHSEASYYASRDSNKFTRNDSESTIVKGQGPTPRSQQVVEYRTDHRKGVGDFYRKSTGNISGPVSGTINATKTLRTEKHRTLDAEILDSGNYAHGTSDSEFEILEGETDQMEWPRQSMECSCGFKFLLWNMEYTGGIDVYQYQRAPKDLVCTASERSYRPINPNIFGQYNNTGIREEIWRYYFDQIIRNRRANNDTLPQNQHSPPNNVRTFSIEPSRRTDQVNSTNGMVSVGPNIRNTELIIRSSRRGPIRLQLEKEAENLLQLVPRHQFYGSEFAGIQLEVLENRRANNDTLPQNQHSPPNNVRTFSIEPSRRTDQVNSTNGMVSVGPNIRNTELIIRSSRRGPIRLQLEKEAENLLQLVPRHQFYGSEFAGIQLETEQTENNSDNTTMEIGDLVPRPSQPIYFPAATSTSKSGSTRPQKRKIPARRALQAQGLSDLAIDIVVSNERFRKRKSRPSIDITPVINRIKLWGHSDGLSDKELTAKLCWLLAVTGFLRASNIHRIDDSMSFISQVVLNLAIVSPKKKRQGRPIIRPCQISRNTDQIL
ncbi:hypothetical protein AYI69_g2476 [Smittium culicis]|uniref:Uncharacterized protein n=1 Tax=Smittium culicis TaxID=133412 RepID=A0A1R1YMB2_9FUNG|nr:hypothetical protein AYI69_g2476 [Smittium culicis]